MAHSKRFVKTVPPPKLVINVLKYGPISASFSFYFRSFLILISISTIQIEKSMEGVLGIRTRRGGDGRHSRNHGAMADGAMSYHQCYDTVLTLNCQ